MHLSFKADEETLLADGLLRLGPLDHSLGLLADITQRFGHCCYYFFYRIIIIECHLSNNFKMSQIKSYLSIDSVPSQQFKTPAKMTIQHMNTNNSLSLSNTLGSLDNKSLWNRRTFYRSNEFGADVNYQTRDFVEQQEEEMENVSSVTLNPVVTQADLFQFVNMVKIVAFLSNECEARKGIISNKEKAIKKLQSQMFLIEQRAKFQKRQFQKKEKTLKSRSLSMQKYKKRVSERIHNDIIDMKLEISQMKRTLSSQKVTLETKKVTISHDKRRSMPAETLRSDRKIYVPIFSNRAYYNHEPIHQRHSSRSEYYQQMVPPNSLRNKPVPIDHSHSYSIKKEKSIQSNIINSVKKTPKSSMFPPPPTPPRSQQIAKGPNRILDLLAQKLQTQPNMMMGMGQNFPQSQQSHEFSPTPSYQIPKITLNQQSTPKNKNRDIEKSSPNLDYFDGPFEDEENLKEEMLMISQKSKKSIKNLKQSARSMTNKWKKDNEDEQIVELLKESLPEKKQSQKSQKRSQIGAKLVVTSINEQQHSLEVPSPDKNAAKSREVSINNGSQVQILIENSDEKKANDSRDSSKRFSAKNIERPNIANSEIGIILQDMNDSIEDMPLNIESKIQSPRKNGLSLYKQVPKIEEVDEPSNTPVDFKIINNLEPSFESRYTITPRQAQPVVMANSHGSNISKEQSINTPPLSRPPSLLQQDDEEDIIDSIKLNGNSRHFQDPPVSKLSKAAVDPVQEEEQDFLGGIRLVAMSRISREKNTQSETSSLKSSDLLENPSYESKMTHSELAPLSNLMSDDANDMEIIDSQLRKSTNSVIVKKGSAIQRSMNRGKQAAAVKQSNRGGSTVSGKSNDLSIPIEQADEQQQQVSNIVRKNMRNISEKL